MTLFIKNISKSIIALAAVSLIFSSCQKENNNPSPLAVQNEKAVVNPINTRVINGNYGNPALGPAAFGTRYVNIYTGAQDSVGTVAYNLRLTSTNNGTIAAKSGYTFKYLVTTTALGSISAANYATATTVTSWGQNTSTTSTPNGWWNYNSTTHVASPVANMVLFVNDGANTYAFKATAIAGQGSATSNRAVYTFQSGIVN